MKHFTPAMISRALSMRTCISLMGELLQESDCYHLNPKHAFPLNNGSLLGSMYAEEKEGKYAVAKIIGLFPHLSGIKDCHQGQVLLFDKAEGELLASFDASMITSLRTAALAAAVTEKFAPKDKNRHLIIGMGNLLPFIQDVFAVTGKIESTTVLGRVSEEELSQYCQNADIITLITNSFEPILKPEHLGKAVHINSIGACTPKLKEVSKDLCRIVEVFVDDKNIASKEAGNFESFLDELEIKTLNKEKTKAHTLFNSTGIASQDLILTRYLYEKY